jgi:hypothetical protein
VIDALRVHPKGLHYRRVAAVGRFDETLYLVKKDIRPHHFLWQAARN